VVALIVSVAAASAATVARSRSVSRDGITATIGFRRATTNGPVPFSDLRLAISRDGRRLTAGPVRSAFCRTLCWPALVPGVPPLRVVDLERNGSPDVVLNLYSGGAHCCYIAQVYRYAAGRYVRVEHDFGDPGATFERLGRRFVFFSADDRFAYRFEPFAFSAFPLQIWTFAHGRFADITRGYPRLVAVDAHQQWLSFVANDPQGTGLGFLAAWAADPRPDLVIGRRNFRSMPPARRLSNELGRIAVSWAVGRSIADNQSGYRLVSRRLAEATLASDEHGFAFEVEQITTCIRMGGTIACVPIRTIYAGEPSHIRPIAHLREFVRIVREARRDVREPLTPPP